MDIMASQGPDLKCNSFYTAPACCNGSSAACQVKAEQLVVSGLCAPYALLTWTGCRAGHTHNADATLLVTRQQHSCTTEPPTASPHLVEWTQWLAS
eukprot:3976081-Amphidinium_carterae.2